MRAIILALAALLALSPLADAKTQRSQETVREFQREHPCPSRGSTRGRCPGYVRDHIVPLACGGPDLPSNMQWQTIAEGKAKDRWERKGCRVNRQALP